MSAKLVKVSNEKHGSASLGTHSQGSASQSSTGTNEARQNQQAAQFRDDNNLQVAVKILTTLEEKTFSLGGTSGNAPPEDLLLLKYQNAAKLHNSDHDSEKNKRNILQEIERALTSRLFQINHVILKNQSVSTLLYHLIMIFEFLQILFFVFYKVEVVNEFKSETYTTSVTSSVQPQANNYSSSIYGLLSNATDINTDDLLLQDVTVTNQLNNKFRIDFYFTFINFQMYTLDNTTENIYTFVYSILITVFFMFLIVLFFMSTQAFEDSKTEEIKESSKIALKILTLIMSLFLFLLQIPLIVILLQGYLCDEDPSERYTVPDIKCDSMTHRLFVVFSTVTLLVYTVFLILQQQLYTSNNFESTLPWSALERRIIMLKVAYKLVLSSCFVFDKSGQIRGEVGLMCGFLNMILVYKRYKSALIFKRSVFYATIFYDVITAWLFVTISFYNISKSEVTILSLSLLIVAGIFLGGMMIVVQIRKRKSYIETQHPERFDTPQDYEQYFYFLYELIEDESPEARSMIAGIIFNHVHYCQDQICPCSHIAESLDDIKKYKKLKQKQEEEEELAMLQAKYDQEMLVHERTIVSPVIEVALTTSYRNPPQKQTKTLKGIKTNFLLNCEVVAPPSTNYSSANNSLFSVGKDSLLGAPKARPTMNIVKRRSSVNSGRSSGLNLLPPVQLEVKKDEVTDTPLISLKEPASISLLTPRLAGLIRGNSKRFDTPLNLGSPGHHIPTAAGIAKTFHLIADHSKSMSSHVQFDFSVADYKKSQRRKYKFLSILVREAIKKFPVNIDLRVINAFIQKSKLSNEFKAIFELMHCEQCSPSLHERFIIFRRKIEVEQNLVKQHFKNIQKIGQLDVIHVHHYEKYFMRYQMYEYLTVYAAQSFWRELMQKHIDASVLQERGWEISKNYEMIQNLAAKLMQIYPNEIKFLYRYGTFLLHIINNEYDAVMLFEQAYNIFQNKVMKKQTAMPVNQQTIFGENSASGIIIISANSSRQGEIIHANDEIETILNYKRRDIIGKNISSLMPRPLGKVHDRFIHRYFDTAKPTVIDIKRQLFGTAKEGYIKEVELIVKVYPNLTDKIIFVGFIQKVAKYEDMDAPKQEYEGLDQQYIVTDQEGNITNVTEGLNSDLGLNAKFFNYSESIFQQMFNIDKICLEIGDHETQEVLEIEGQVVTFDTRNILNNIELEQLTAEEILEIRSNLGSHQAYVQLKRLVLDQKFCTIHVYRVIILPKNGLGGIFGSSSVVLRESNVYNISSGESSSRTISVASAASLAGGVGGGIANPGAAGMSFASSMNSSTSTSYSFNRIIKDFKKALSERQTPQNIVMLNRIMSLILLSTIIMTSVVFSLEQTQITQMSMENLHQLNSQCRSIQIVQLASNLRSFINIANGYEFNEYEPGSLQAIDRFEYLGRLIQSQATQLSKTHQIQTRQRSDDDTADDIALSQFDYQPALLFRLDHNNRVTSYEQPFRVAFSTYLNNILMMNISDRASIQLQSQLLKSAPQINDQNLYNETNLIQKSAYFLMVNGLRSLRTFSENSVDFQKSTTLKNLVNTPFLAIMIVGVIISTASIMVILYHIWGIEQNKAEILSLYALLSMKEIAKVNDRCRNYMDNLNEGRTIGTQLSQKWDPKQEENDYANEVENSQGVQINTSIKEIQFRIGIAANFAKSITPGVNNSPGAFLFGNQQSGGGAHPEEEDSQISEEEKEAIMFKRYVYKKKLQRLKDSRVSAAMGNSHAQSYNGTTAAKKTKATHGNELYTAMIKQTLEEIRGINEKEDKQKNQKYQKKAENAKIRNQHENEDDNPVYIQKQKKTREKIVKTTINAGMKGKTKKHRTDLRASFQEHLKLEDETEESGSSHYEVKKSGNVRFKADGTDDNTFDPEDENSERNKKEEIAQEQSEFDLDKEEIEERKKLFFKTIKTKNWWQIIANVIVGILFGGYFIQMYVVGDFLKYQLGDIQQSVPTLLDRYKNIMLSYTFLRERMINNNSLETYELNQFYGHDLDQMYRDLSTKVESDVKILKNSQQAIEKPFAEFTKLADSEKFCSSIVGDQVTYELMTNHQSLSYTSILNDATLKKQYATIFQTTVRALKAAEKEEVVILTQLFRLGVDLSSGDYDRRTPLHLAVRAGKYESVVRLLEFGVRINAVDRWGSTPLNYAEKGSQIETLLISRGATFGKLRLKIHQLATNFTENYYKLFFASYRNDQLTVTALQSLDININIQDSEGRTALMIASSEGNLDVVQALIAQGAELSILDSRGNDAILDARREKRIAVVDYINKVISQTIIRRYCSQFGDGILKKGMYQAIGSFHKRFADLLIKVTMPQRTLQDRMSYLKEMAHEGDARYNMTAIQSYFSTQELYLPYVIDQYIALMESSFNNATTEYQQTIQILFLAFLGVQFFILFVLRAKQIKMMKDDIFQSRGILNLIPDDFFEQHRVTVEKLIIKLKN